MDEFFNNQYISGSCSNVTTNFDNEKFLDMEEFDYTQQGFYISQTVKLASGQSAIYDSSGLPFDWGHNSANLRIIDRFC